MHNKTKTNTEVKVQQEISTLIDNAKILMTNGSLIKVESIAEYYLWSICISDNRSKKLDFLSGPLRKVLLFF